MMKKPLLTLLAISLSNLCIAVETDGQWYINPTLGYQHLDSGRNLEDDGVLGLGLEYKYNESWGTEIKYLQGSMDTDIGNSNDADVSHLLLEGMYYLESTSEEKFSPYLAAGLGHSQYDYNISGKNDETAVLVGPGFRYGINERWSSKVDLRWVHGVDDSQNDGLLTVALSYALGQTKKAVVGDADKDGVNDSKDQCPNSPIGMEIDTTGCVLDSDGDGVPNATDQCRNSPKGIKVDTKGCEPDSDRDGVADSKDQCPNTVANAMVDNTGCAEKLSQTENITLNVTFATGSAKLTNNFMAEIEKVAFFMRKYASASGIIEGHTDSSGSAKFNKDLSQRRAETVRNILINKFGIESHRLVATGYGETRPTASDDTLEGRQANRRVVAVFEAQETK